MTELTRQIKTGDGWRVGWDPAAPQFKGLVAGADWAIELTEEELTDLRQLVEQLTDTIAAIAPELMPTERICCEAETERLWLEAEGWPSNYSLRLILLTGRGAEGMWPAAVTPAIQAALKTLSIF